MKTKEEILSKSDFHTQFTNDDTNTHHIIDYEDAVQAMDEYANQYKSLLKELLPMAEDGYNGYVKSGSCHQEFLSEDRELLSRVRAVLAVSPLNTKTNGA